MAREPGPGPSWGSGPLPESKTPLSHIKARHRVALLSGVKAAAFDLDQTLIDFAGSRRAGLEAMLGRIAAAGLTVDRGAFLGRHKELTALEDESYLRSGTWSPTEARFRTLCEEFGFPADGFAGELTQVYTEARYANLRKYPETEGVLKALRGRLPLFLVTNGLSAHQHREIEVTGVAPFFDRLFVCDDFGLRKPDPKIFEMIRGAAGVQPPEMLMVGDFWEADIEVPRRLGWRTVWVVRDDGLRAAADRSKADAVVRSVAEVPGLLARAPGA